VGERRNPKNRLAGNTAVSGGGCFHLHAWRIGSTSHTPPVGTPSIPFHTPRAAQVLTPLASPGQPRPRAHLPIDVGRPGAPSPLASPTPGRVRRWLLPFSRTCFRAQLIRAPRGHSFHSLSHPSRRASPYPPRAPWRQNSLPIHSFQYTLAVPGHHRPGVRNPLVHGLTIRSSSRPPLVARPTHYRSEGRLRRPNPRYQVLPFLRCSAVAAGGRCLAPLR